MERIRIPTPPRPPGTVERAFQIARAGECREMGELVRILKAERQEAVEEHLAGQSIRRDLRRAWEAALAGKSAAPIESPAAAAASGPIPTSHPRPDGPIAT